MFAVALAALMSTAGCSGGASEPAAPESAAPAFRGAAPPGLAAQPAWHEPPSGRAEGGDFGTSTYNKVVGFDDVFAYLRDEGENRGETLLFLDAATGRERARIPVPSTVSQGDLEPAEVDGRQVVVLTYATSTEETAMQAAQQLSVIEVYDSAANVIWREAAEDGDGGFFRNGWVLRSEQADGVEVDSVHDLQDREVWTAEEPTWVGRQHVVGVHGDLLVAQYGEVGELTAYRLSAGGAGQLWRTEDIAPPGEDGPAEAPDVIGFAEGKMLIHWQLGIGSFAIVAHDPASGAIAWTLPVERGHRWSGFHQELAYDRLSGLGAVHSDQGVTLLDIRSGRLLWESAEGDRAFRLTALTGGAVYGLIDEELPIAVSTSERRPLGENLTALPVASAGGFVWATSASAEHWIFPAG